MTELLQLALDFHQGKISAQQFQDKYVWEKWNGGTKKATEKEVEKEISIYYATEFYNPELDDCNDFGIDEKQLRKEIAQHLQELGLI